MLHRSRSVPHNCRTVKREGLVSVFGRYRTRFVPMQGHWTSQRRNVHHKVSFDETVIQDLKRSIPHGSDLSDDFVPVEKRRLQELINAEVQQLASVKPHPITMRQVIDTLDAHRAAEFMLMDVPKRFAARIKAIERLDGWDEVPELLDMHSMISRWYTSLRLVRMDSQVGLKDFIKCIIQIRQEGNPTISIITKGMQRLYANHLTSANDEYYDEDFLNTWMDDFLLSRMGSNVLLDQCVALAKEEEGGLGKATGMVELKCNATIIANQAAQRAVFICKTFTGKSPIIEIENFVAGMDGPQPDIPCIFSYIPGFLHYILTELLKNSLNATVKNARDDEDLKNRPVRIMLCHDDHRLLLRVSDRAGGIPFEIGDRIWSYFCGAAARNIHSDDAPAPTPLAGYGVGLPVSRLCAVYLGGNLHITTYPGYGTEAHLYLPTTVANQREVMPMSYA